MASTHRRRSTRVLLACAAASAACTAAPAFAASSLQWGPTGTGGGGTWTVDPTPGAANWFDGAATVSWDNATPASAVFGGTGAAVTVDNTAGAVQAAGLTFGVNGYTIGGGTLILVGTGPSVAVSNASDTATLASALAGSAPTVSGAGTLVLGGANTFTGTFTLNGGTVQLANAGALNAGAPVAVAFGSGSTGVLQLNGNAVTVAGLATNATVGTPVVENAGGTAATLTVNLAGGSQTFAGVLRDQAAAGGAALGLTKSGGGTLTLSGTNAYTGATTVSAGVLAVSSAAGLGGTGAGAGTTVSSGAALQASGTITVAEPLTITGTGVSGAGALWKTGANTTTWSGAVTLGTGGARVNADAGTLTISGGVSGTGQPLTVGGAGNTTISGLIATGSGGTIIKDGTGTLTLSNGSNSFSAPATSSVVITVLGGTLIQAGESASTAGSASTTGLIPSAATPSYVLLNGGTFTSSRAGVGVTFLATNKGITLGANGGTLGVSDTTSGNLNIYGGVITGSGSLTYAGPGVLSLTNDHTYTGSTTVTGGILRLRTTVGASVWLPQGTDLTVASGGTFDMATFSQTVGSLAGAGNVVASATSTATLTVGGPTATPNNNSTTFSGAIQSTAAGVTSLGLTKRGTGTLTLSGANQYTGTTTINAGKLAIAAAERIADASAVNVASGATFDLTNNGAGNFNETVASLTGAGGINLGTATLALAGTGTGTVTFSGSIAGTGVLTKGGTFIQTLSGANSLSALNLNAGRINFNNNAAAGGAGVPINIANAAGIEFTGSATGIVLPNPIALAAGTNPVLMYATSGNALKLTGVISGGGSILRNDTGAGTLTLAGNNTFTGGVTITSRTLVLGSGAALGAGTFTVGDAVTAPANAIVISADTPLTGASAVPNAVTVNQTFQLGGTNAIELTGVLSGAGGLTKTGTATHVLGGAAANTFAGLTTVNGGVLGLNKPPTVNAIAGNVQLGDATGGGTLRLLAADQIANASNLTITNAATFDLNGRSEALGTLTLAGNGTIDFGAGTTSVLAFADSSAVTPAWAAASLLTVTNWSGVPNVGGGTEQLRFGTTGGGLTPGQVGQIQFVLADGTYPAAILATGEVVAVVPEPASALAAASAGVVGLLARRGRRRRAGR
ncbi:MAG TPA: autotransporter-associated beta strand repeat-containing protein [Humisphaera sp.]